jgi:magnesium chelatase family protein
MTISRPGPGVACVHGAVLAGIHAQIIQVQATITAGPPSIAITGVPGGGGREMRDRVRAAVLNSGLAWPSGGITVNVGPASSFHRGCGLDLAIAVAILAAAGTVPAGPVTGRVFAADLGLDGQLRPVRGIVPVLMAAAIRGGHVTAVIAPENTPEAAILPGTGIVPVQSLGQVAAWLRGEPLARRPVRPALPSSAPEPVPHEHPGPAGLGVSPVLRQVLEASAAGGHHLCLTGPPGADVPALAASLVTLLPDLTGPEAAEVAAIYSAAGLLGSACTPITRPPLRVPHHTVTIAAVTGGGAGLQPGEAALAHGGVLCLNDAPEFERAVLRTLTQPLSNGEILIARGGAIARFPARFILVTGMRPCPCGAGSGCTCTPPQTRRYRSRVTGTLGAWMPLRVAVDPADLAPLADAPSGGEADALSAAQVAQARDRMNHRLAGTSWRRNGDIPHHELQRTYPPAGDGLALIDHAVERGVIGNLGAGHITAVAWTLADLAGRSRPGADECAQALAFWTGAAR